MTTDGFDFEGTSLSAQNQVDQICDAFEKELQSGHRPEPSEFLRQAPAALRPILLEELLLISLEYTSGGQEHEATRPTASLGPVSFSEIDESRAISHSHSSTAPIGQPFTERLMPAVPQVIGGFELLGELGRGGMGVVYRARQVSIDRMVALKIIRNNRICTADATHRQLLITRFRREAKAASRLKDDNIATVFEIGEFGEDPYYAMQLVEGPSLADLIEKRCLSVDQAVRYLIPVARTIDKLHAKGVVHRDLKPSNILIEQATDKPIITDFGLAKLADAEQNVTLSDEGFGSPPYMAPEQVMHATSVTGAADIYSLGATLYHLLTGRPPFQAAAPAEIARQIIYCEPLPPRQLNPSVPRDLETICLKCLEKDEHRRYASARDLAADLDRYLNSRPIAARPAGVLGRTWKMSRRNPTAFTLSVGLIVVLLAAGLVGAYWWSKNIAADFIAQQAELARRANDSKEFYRRSQFAQAARYEALPWLVQCLERDAGTPREALTRRRIRSVLAHGPELARVYMHAGTIVCADFSPGGDLLLTGGSGRAARLWSTRTGECLQELPHESPVRQAVFNHRGDMLATASDDGKLQLWATGTGRPIHDAFQLHGYVSFLAFSADDDLLLGTSDDEHVVVWQTLDGTPRATISGAEAGGRISDINLSPDGRHGISISGTNSALLWKILPGDVAPVSLPHGEHVICARFSPDGTVAATGSEDGTLRVWDVASGQMRAEMSHDRPVSQIAFDVDSKHVITMAGDQLAVRSLVSADTPAGSARVSNVKAIVVNPRGGTFLTITDEGAIAAWGLPDARPMGHPFAHGGAVSNARFSRDGDYLLTLAADGAVRVWKCDQGGAKWQAPGITDLEPVGCLAGGLLLAATPGGARNTLIAVGSSGRTSFLKHAESIVAACVSFDGQRVATVDAQNRVAIWNPKTREVVTRFQAAGLPTAIALNRNGQILALGDASSNIVLSNTDQGQTLRQFKLARKALKLEFSRTSDELLAVDAQCVRILRIDRPSSVEYPPIQLDAPIGGARLSPDGVLVVIYGSSNRAVLLDATTGIMRTLRATSPIKDACFTPDSSELLTVAEDGTAQLWSTAYGVQTGETMKHGGALKRIVLSPDGETAALCDDAGRARLWHLTSGQPTSLELSFSAKIVHLQFLSPNSLLAVTQDAATHEVPIGPNDSPISELANLAAVSTGRKVDAAGECKAVAPAQLLTLWREMQSKEKR